jgi:hypothetical protein
MILFFLGLGDMQIISKGRVVLYSYFLKRLFEYEIMKARRNKYEEEERK